jgi:hypothetical protein
MRFAVLASLFLLAACATPAADPRPVAEVGLERAYFDAFPTRLFAAMEAVCSQPGQSVVRPSATELRCESLPDPQTAAALILGYGGTINELPQLIVGLSAAPEGAGFVITADHFIRVPQPRGPERQIRLRDARLAAEMRDVLVAAGGVLVPWAGT